MKKLLIVLCLLLVIGGCGNKKELNDVKTVGEKMVALCENSMLEVNSDSELFSYISDVDYDLIDSYYLAYDANGLADEIVIVRVKKNSNLETIKESIEEHRQSRIKLYRSYNPDQVTRVENGLLFTYENDVIMIVGDNQDQLEKTYKESIEK